MCQKHVPAPRVAGAGSHPRQHQQHSPQLQGDGKGAAAAQARWSVSDAPNPCHPAGQAIGANILADLQRQRQQIEHTRQQAQQTDANVATADSTLKRMSQWWRLW